MKKEALIWQVIVFILGLLFVLTIREYLLGKNEIESSTAYSNCLIEESKAKAEGALFTLYTCTGIRWKHKHYKLWFDE